MGMGPSAQYTMAVWQALPALAARGRPSARAARYLSKYRGYVTAALQRCYRMAPWRPQRPQLHAWRKVTWFDVRCALRALSGGREAEEWPKHDA
jgi:hypothetical protein